MVSNAVISKTIQVILSAFLHSLSFAFSKISKTVMFKNPSANKISTKKLSPPPIYIILALFGKLISFINYIVMVGCNCVQLNLFEFLFVNILFQCAFQFSFYILVFFNENIYFRKKFLKKIKMTKKILSIIFLIIINFKAFSCPSHSHESKSAFSEQYGHYFLCLNCGRLVYSSSIAMPTISPYCSGRYATTGEHNYVLIYTHAPAAR